MFIRAGLLGLFLVASGAVSPKVNAQESVFEVPKHLQNISSPAIQNIYAPNKQLLLMQSDNKSHSFSLNLKQGLINIDIQDVTQNKQGISSFSTSFTANSVNWTLIYTQGQYSGFGELFGNGQHLVIEQRGEQVFVIDVGISGLTPKLHQDDVVGQLYSPTAFSEYVRYPNKGKTTTAQQQSNDELVTVDVMLLYTKNIVDTFPNEMTQTLLNHLVFKANQSFFDSKINMRLRLVHSQFVDYPNPSNIVALNELRAAVDGDSSTQTDPSLANIAQLRENFGVDLIAMIRTHDLNEREVCGIAMFPNPNEDFLVNISNVGISGGSNCMDTFTHEVGHNFGAGHQRFNGNPQGSQPAAGALIVQNKFNTIMSSIGTGDINRDFGLPVFSNPDIICATLTCGDAISANNAATINNFSAINAALRPAVIETQVPTLFASLVDRDGDSVFDNNDAFPFDPNETADTDLDGIGDNQDAFLNDPIEQLDTDLDGIGNNADDDDDNDGTVDSADALPLDPANTIDADGDEVGENDDDLDTNFQEISDSDGDLIGDRADLDDDNDGVADYFIPTTLNDTEAWVVSAGSDNILRYNSQTGEFIQSLLTVPTGGFSFRSDAILSDSQQLYFIAFSDVLAFDRQTNSIRKVIDRASLATNFPAHLAFQNNTTLLVNNGLGVSNIESFGLLEGGNQSLDTTDSTEVWRDIALLPNNVLLSAVRDTNTLVTFSLNNLNAAPQILASQGLNKPEHIAVDNDSNIYVTNAGSKDVSQFDINGNFLGRFISPGSGGLGMPGCITIGPDGHFYICSSDTNQVLKYDGQTGAFLNIFVDAGTSSLQQPVSIVFAGLPLDEFRLDGEHDSDGDSLNNNIDSFPLDATETIDSDNDGIGNNADSDDDNDLMPDEYEIANSLNPLLSADAQLDNDSDGSSNLAEFQAGTDPNDANSTPVVVTPTPKPAPTSSGGGGTMGILFVLYMSALLFVRRQYN
jgi:hypothetical protein